MSKITFSRTHDGSFNFTEVHVGRINASLRERVGEQGPRVPVMLMNAASSELIRVAHVVADRCEPTRNGDPQDDPALRFYFAMRRVVRERPELFWLTRGVAVPDADPSADVSL